MAAALCPRRWSTWPILRASWLIVFTRPFSILDGVQALLADGDWVITSVTIAFSVLFPLAKIVTLAVL